jgi:transposase
MSQNTRYLGLDVDAETVSAAVAEIGGEVRSLGTVPNRPEPLRKLLRRLGRRDQLRVCYEAGPTGYGLYWLLTGWGIQCDVVAPSLVPSKPGDRVKTNRRDAEKLARSHRAGDLTPVWVPDADHEALRDLLRAREVAKSDQLRARHRLSKFLLRQDRRPPKGMRRWTQSWMAWVRQEVKFDRFAQQAVLEDYLAQVDHSAERIRHLEHRIDDAIEEAPASMQTVIAGLQALRGIAKITAVSIVSEVGRLSRFARARQLMGYSGMVPSEHSTGQRVRRGSITKTGNAHLRRVVVEAAWAYRHRPRVSPTLRRRHTGLPPDVLELAWKAQQRLHQRYRRLAGRGKPKQHVVTVVGRELLGFIWDIGVRLEKQMGVTVQPL